MLWRSKSNKNRTAHAGVEPAGDSGQQPDTAKLPAKGAGGSSAGAPQQPGVPKGNSTAGSVTGAPQPTGAPTTAPGAGAPQHHTVDDALKQASRPTRKEMLAQMAESEEGRAMLKKLQGLRSMDSLKNSRPEIRSEPRSVWSSRSMSSSLCRMCSLYRKGSRQSCRVLREHGAA